MCMQSNGSRDKAEIQLPSPMYSVQPAMRFVRWIRRVEIEI
jgi:hypothetical protein